METIYERFANDLNCMAQAWDCLEFKIIGIEELDFQMLQDALRNKGIQIKLRRQSSEALDGSDSNHIP